MYNNSNTSVLKKAINSIFLIEIAFFLISLIEIYAEYIDSPFFLLLSKPLLIPILLVLYILNSPKRSSLYIIALLFNWFANLFFIFNQINFLIIASISFLIYRILIIIKIFKDDKSLGLVPLVLGSIPFLFLFLSLINMVYENINGGQFYLIVVQIILMTILGGFSLGNYVIKNDIPSKILLISSLFFGINLFALGVKFYFIDFVFLKPIAMIFFVFGHYIFYHFIILSEKKSLF